MKLEVENVFIQNGIIHALIPNGRKIAASYLTVQVCVNSEIPENRSYEADNRFGSRKRIIPHALDVKDGKLYVRGAVWDDRLGYAGRMRCGVFHYDIQRMGPIVKLTERDLTSWEL